MRRIGAVERCGGAGRRSGASFSMSLYEFFDQKFITAGCLASGPITAAARVGLRSVFFICIPDPTHVFLDRNLWLDQNFFDQNILDQNILDQNILDQNIFDQNIFDQNIFDQNILDQNI